MSNVYKFIETKMPVKNRGIAPDSFLIELIEWANTAPKEIFDYNEETNDIYDSIKPELGPWDNILHRKAAMLETMRVLAGFESSWNWNEGIDTSNPSSNTKDTAEAGMWQISYNSQSFGQDLKDLLKSKKITNGIEFQSITKSEHIFACEYVARLFRHTYKHNGPLYKNRSIFPKKLQGEENSIYPWLSKKAVDEFKSFLV